MKSFLMYVTFTFLFGLVAQVGMAQTTCTSKKEVKAEQKCTQKSETATAASINVLFMPGLTNCQPTPNCKPADCMKAAKSAATAEAKAVNAKEAPAACKTISPSASCKKTCKKPAKKAS
jgi:hypothetical protein